LLKSHAFFGKVFDEAQLTVQTAAEDFTADFGTPLGLGVLYLNDPFVIATPKSGLLSHVTSALASFARRVVIFQWTAATAMKMRATEAELALRLGCSVGTCTVSFTCPSLNLLAGVLC